VTLLTGDGTDTATALQLTLEASPNGILVVDAAGRILFVNGEVERQFGYGREELVGQLVDLLLPEALGPIRAVHHEGLALAPLARPMGPGLDLFGRRKDGTPISVEIGLKPIHLAAAPCVLAAIADTTERRRIQELQRAALEEQLEFERFVANLSFQFINFPDEEIGGAVRSGLERLGLQLGLDRNSFIRFGPEHDVFDAVTWTRPGISGVEPVLSTRERFPWVFERVLAGEVVSFSTTSEIPSAVDRDSYRGIEVRSAVLVPLRVGGRVAGAMGFNAVADDRKWSPTVLHRLEVFAGVFEQVLARKQRDDAAKSATLEIQRLKDQLQAETVYLRQEVREQLGPADVVGQSAALRRVMEQVRQVAGTDSTVLLLGETGTGKELFAKQIHELSGRRARSMVRVNCAAIPSTLIESELFGREKGAYTGALARQIGRFELADHSTIFLDEIGDLPPDMQVKLLRVLEERQVERLGSPRPIAIDTRIIAATHRNLLQRISEGTFRQDLYYRLNVFPIRVPPLRERAEDIPLLVWRFVEEFSRAFGKRIEAIDRDNLMALQHYTWPGNVRELRHVVERAMITASGKRLTITLPQTSVASVRRSAKLLDVEKEHIRGVLESTGWRIRGVGGAAERLGLKPTTLETRMAKLGLKRPGHRSG
jgi:formate hydrogenlyase transcriptional activator